MFTVTYLDRESGTWERKTATFADARFAALFAAQMRVIGNPVLKS